MLANVPVALTLALMVSLALANRFAPRAAVRLAVAPLRRRVALPLPARAAALLTPPLEGGGTYRTLPSRELVLTALPGEARVERDKQIVRFMPELHCVLAHPAWSPSQLVCVDLSVSAEGLSLRGRRFPEEELWAAACLILPIARFALGRPWLAAFTIGGGIFFVIRAWRAANASFDAVVAELTARIALANGDAPPPPPPPPREGASRFTGPDEWTCACGKVNERKRSMCRRCWAQRPSG
jgi:hypothetical protein